MEPNLVYAAVRARIGAALADAGPGADHLTVLSCPDWDVSDLTAHLAGTTNAIVSGDLPHGDPQPWVDAQVAARAGRTAIDNWREWDAAGEAFEQVLPASPNGLGSLLYDAIIHEDDLNAAIGRPAPRDEDAVRFGLERLFWRLDRDGRAKKVGTLVANCRQGTFRAATGDPTVALGVADPWELLRSLGSRRSERQLRELAFVGDLTPWLAVLPHELPIVDLYEN
ncbi:MAG: hypothetical protein WAS51_10435 [Ilumatobacteraceae bacterium]